MHVSKDIPSPGSSPRVVKIPGQRLRDLASKILKLHPRHHSPPRPSASPTPVIRVVCVSDTHNSRPDLPPGDVLVHSGDLTEHGSFEEVQAGLTWLSSQPHRYKIFVAGNHDVLLDEAFLNKYPERRYGLAKTMHDLEWGNVLYLRDSSTNLKFLFDSTEAEPLTRNLNMFGSPWTPQYGISAFQYPREQDIWTNTLDPGVDIVVTHGPPRLHLDTRGFHRAGCPFLAAEIARVRPRLVVFGHIHAAHGREDVVLDGVRRAYEEITNDWAGYGALIWMAIGVLRAKLAGLFTTTQKGIDRERVTTFVNASIVRDMESQQYNQPIVVEL